VEVVALGVEAKGGGTGAEIGAERIPWCRAAQPGGAGGMGMGVIEIPFPLCAVAATGFAGRAAFTGEWRTADAIDVRVAVGEDRSRGKDSE
jgi:hypothetical protein